MCEEVCCLQIGKYETKNSDRQEDGNPQARIDAQGAGQEKLGGIALAQETSGHQKPAGDKEQPDGDVTQAHAEKMPQRFGLGVPRGQGIAVTDKHGGCGDKTQQVEVVVASGGVVAQVFHRASFNS